MSKLRNILFLTFLTLLSLQIKADNLPYSIEPIANNAGIFYFNLGTAKISNDHYTLLSYTNISFYFAKLQFTKSVFENSRQLCTPEYVHSHITNCLRPLTFIQIQIPQLESKFETISHLVGQHFEKPRQKRGLFNGASYVLNWLFGTPDSDDAQYYSDSIKMLVEKNHDVQMLMKQQIHIISNAIQNYNESIQNFKINEDKLNDNILQFNKFVNSTKQAITSLAHSESFLEHNTLLIQLVEELNEQFDVIISSILFAKQNILHPSIITPKNLQLELLKVKLSGDIEFPISVTEYDQIYKYFSIAELSVVYNQEVLIYAIKLPLVHQRTYNLYNLIPLPVSYNNSNIYSYIDPPFNFLLISTTRTHYSRSKDLNNCKKLSEEYYVCVNTIIQTITENPVCETLLKINEVSKIPDDCPTRTIKAQIEVWHPLTTNSWLFIITKRITATISCSNIQNQILDVNLNGTGILKLRSKCKCYTFNSMLTATSERKSNFTNYIPSIDINADDCCIHHRQYLQQNDYEMKTIQLNNLDLDSLRHSRHKLEQFDEILQENINKPYIIRHSYWYNIFFGIVLIIVLILIFCCCCRGNRLYRLWKCSRCIQCCPPNICITNHNERVQLNENQLMRLTRLLREDSTNPGVNAIEGEPSSSSNELPMNLTPKPRRPISDSRINFEF